MLSVICSIAIEDIPQIPLQLADADFIALRSIQQVDNDDNDEDEDDDDDNDDNDDDDDDDDGAVDDDGEEQISS